LAGRMTASAAAGFSGCADERPPASAAAPAAVTVEIIRKEVGLNMP